MDIKNQAEELNEDIINEEEEEEVEEDEEEEEEEKLNDDKSQDKTNEKGVSNRITAIVSSHKQMRRSASAPLVANKDGEDLNPKKRNRTTPEQLLILEEAFLKNPTPTSQVRDAIAEKVEMSSRSVQIWFQNRRAKLKLQEKKHSMKPDFNYPFNYPPFGNRFTLRNEIQRYPFQSSYSNYSSTQMYHFSPGQHSPLSPSSLSPSNSPTLSPSSSTDILPEGDFRLRSSSLGSSPFNLRRPIGGNSNEMMGPNANQFNLPRIYFALERLKIGSWTRITLNLHDLLCKIEPSFQLMSWEIVEGPHRCKIEFNFSSLASFELQIVNETISLLTIFLTSPPNFYLEVLYPDGRSSWKTCNDITEGQQASSQSKHVIQAPSAVLKHYLTPLIFNDPIISKIATINCDNKLPYPVNFIPDNEIEDFEEDERTMRKSQSVPTLPRKSNLSGYFPGSLELNQNMMGAFPLEGELPMDEEPSIFLNNNPNGINQQNFPGLPFNRQINDLNQINQMNQLTQMNQQMNDLNQVNQMNSYVPSDYFQRFEQNYQATLSQSLPSQHHFNGQQNSDMQISSLESSLPDHRAEDYTFIRTSTM